jgi:hypothetical protein
MVPPRSPVYNTWRDGVYRGFVVEVDRESQLPINLPKGNRKRINPDDPDGDEIETVLWVDPEELKSNQMVRQELRRAMRKVQLALKSEMSDDVKWGFRAEGVEMRQGRKSAAMPTSGLSLVELVAQRRLQVRKTASARESIRERLKDYATRRAIADKLLPMDTTSGRLADYLTHGWGGERSGRAQQLAEAAGVDPSFNVRYPTTSGVLSSLAGGGIGALSGASLGHTLGSGSEEATLAGSGVGALLGSLLGAAYNAKSRRQDMREIKEEFADQDHLSVGKPNFSTLATIAAPLRGPHRTGQMQAHRALTGKSHGLDDRSVAHDAGYIANMLGGFPVSALTGIAQNANAALNT